MTMVLQMDSRTPEASQPVSRASFFSLLPEKAVLQTDFRTPEASKPVDSSLFLLSLADGNAAPVGQNCDASLPAEVT